MNDDKNLIKSPHNVIMEERKTLTVTGVSDIDSFDEETVVVYTDLGQLTVKGFNLHINKIDVDDGELNLEGEIDSLSYSDPATQKGSFFSRMFR